MEPRIGRMNLEAIAALSKVPELEPSMIPLPELRKKIIITGVPGNLRPDGAPNGQHTVRGGTVVYDGVTDRAVLLFQGITPRVDRQIDPLGIKRSGIYAAQTTDGWENVLYFDGRNPALEDRASAQPVLNLGQLVKYATHGPEDPRITARFAGGKEALLVVNCVNKHEIERSVKKTGGDRNIPLRGATAGLVVLPDPEEPATYKPLGPIGPDFEYSKNVLIHQEVLDRDGVPHVLIYGNKTGGVQGYTIPFGDLPTLINDDAFRNDYWRNQFRPENLAKNSIIQPRFDWEGYGDKLFPHGHISGGHPPLKISYSDHQSGEEKNAWLLFYNSVPYFDRDSHKEGRLTGAVLLDPENPFHVIARSPIPIINITEGYEIAQDNQPVSFATSAYIDKDKELHIIYSAGADECIVDGSCPADEFVDYLLQFDKNGKKKNLKL